MDKKTLEELSANHEKWDNHLATAEHTVPVSDEEERAIDDALGLQMISMRLNRSLIEQLKGLARLEGIGYQPLIRQVLTKYARDNEYKLDTLLSAQEAADRADKLFTQALKLRSEITKLKPLSNERITQETDYSKALSQAQALFTQAIDNSKDLVLTQHAKRRVAQIAEVCRQDLEANEEKKYGKKKKAV